MVPAAATTRTDIATAKYGRSVEPVPVDGNAVTTGAGDSNDGWVIGSGAMVAAGGTPVEGSGTATVGVS